MDSILDFVLALEILENELYKAVLGTSGSATQSNAFATVRAQARAAAGVGVVASLTQIQKHEAAHVATLQALGAANTFGLSAASFDFSGNRSAAGGGPFARAMTDLPSLVALLQVVEDTVVRAYKGQVAGLIGSSAVLETVLRIHSVEARHATRIRRLAGTTGVGTAQESFDEPLDRAGVVAVVQPFFIPTIS